MTLRQQYQRARKNFLSRLRSAEKKGYIIPENIVPKIPKKPTKASIDRLNRLKSKDIYKRSKFASEETYGEIVGSKKAEKILKERRKKEREKKKRLKEAEEKVRIKQEEEAKKKKEEEGTTGGVSNEPFDLSEIIIQNFFNELLDFPKSPYRDLIKNVILDEIKKHGKKEVADSLLKCADAGYYPQRSNMYDQRAVSEMLNYFLEHLPSEGKMYAEDQMEKLNWYIFKGKSLEELEDWEDIE